MTQKKKLEDKTRRNPRNVSLEEFESLINLYGYIEEGKHPKVIIGSFTMTYKRENPVKSCYVRDLLEIIDSLKNK